MHERLRLPRRYPGVHVHRLSARRGCVVLELDMVQLPGTELGPEAADLVCWLQALRLQQLVDVPEGAVVSAQVRQQLPLMVMYCCILRHLYAFLDVKGYVVDTFRAPRCGSTPITD